MSTHSAAVRDQALHRLRTLVGELGTGGGVLTPSVYDTARVAALLPHRPHTGELLDWLASRQHPDGGWGTPHIPQARDLPTLAAVLALHRSPAHRDAAHSGATFLRRHAPAHWGGTPGHDIPVAVEVLLPPLLYEARTAGLAVPVAPYRALCDLGEHRRRLIARRAPHPPGTAPLHSWEGWGTATDGLPVDGSGGIGHSPAATAAALRQSTQPPGAGRLEDYLTRAATAARAPLLPTVWPIGNFERTWVLHALALAGLLHHPLLADVCARQLDLLQASLTSDGIGMSHHFTADGDITATAVVVLALAGRPVGTTAVDRFRHQDHYRTYPNELQPSLTTTAHALHAHTAAQPPHQTAEAPEPVRRLLLERQGPDGRWDRDKWHTSWIYTTAQVVTALPEGPAARRAVRALLQAQHPDGGWGASPRATAGETGYAVLALHTAAPHSPASIAALHRAADWLTRWHDTRRPCDCRLWTGKEPYCPTRVDYAVALTALTVAGL
ncbi:prenyltransferase/squalene oxidase repeat-containing protein [Streptomyces sp. NPDC006197]|uniref:prenyltransferase/squalene oxidase repeat-containing protein n=1 Tax=Streptomyces sp. NPDC006197 TaxID=3156685 RepID=UPI0033ABF9D6